MENDTVSSKYKFNTSSATRENQVTEPTKTFFLPLSLENNASVSGTSWRSLVDNLRYHAIMPN